jgi:pentose-5-phosphate-3-epimerase
MRDLTISASILSADMGCLVKESVAVLQAGANSLHIDVMDNHFVWENLDSILMMSVNPGFAEQHFIPEVLNKISSAKQLISTHKPTIRLGVDGGIKKNNIAEIAKAGADTFILGSGIFNTENYIFTLTELRSELNL